MTPLKTPVKSMGGLIGGEAQKLAQHDATGAARSAAMIAAQGRVSYAMAVLEVNASMGLIVAAPTAGSRRRAAGRAVRRYRTSYRHLATSVLIDALFNAGAIGLSRHAQRDCLPVRRAAARPRSASASAMAASRCGRAAGRLSAGSACDAAVHRADEHAGSGLRPGRRAGRGARARTATRSGVANALVCRRAVALPASASSSRSTRCSTRCMPSAACIPLELRETALGGCAATPSACEKCGLCS